MTDTLPYYLSDTTFLSFFLASFNVLMIVIGHYHGWYSKFTLSLRAAATVPMMGMGLFTQDIGISVSMLIAIVLFGLATLLDGFRPR